MRTNVYIDGFNLYYRLKEARTKWLDPHRLVKSLLPKSEFGQLRYFTARVTPTPGDPQKLQRQLTYLRALQTIPNLTIHEGHFLAHEVEMPLAYPERGGNRSVLVVRTEEKGSDVNLATCLLCDGFDDLYDVAAVITNDSDQVPPIQAVRQRLKKQVVILNPNPSEPSAELKRAANLVRDIRSGLLRACQFPPVIEDQNGTIRMPALWDSFAWCASCRQARDAEVWVAARRSCPNCGSSQAVAWTVLRVERPDYPESPNLGVVYAR